MTKITPLDIRKHSFKKSYKGYDTEEVDAFLEMLAKQYEEIVKENLTLNERVKGLEEQISEYKNLEKTLRDTLISAQTMTDKMKGNAMKEAELIVKDAEIKSEQIYADARKRSNDLRAEIADLEKQKESFIIKFKSMIKNHLQMLEIEEKK